MHDSLEKRIGSGRVKCLICNEKIPYVSGDTEMLVQHVQVYHPDFQVVGLTQSDSSQGSQGAPMPTPLQRETGNYCDDAPSGYPLVEIAPRINSSSEFQVPYNRVNLQEEVSDKDISESNSSARCILCKMQIKYDKEKKENLVEHVNYFHPYLDLAGGGDELAPEIDSEISKPILQEYNPTKTGRTGVKKEVRWKTDKEEIVCWKCGKTSLPDKKRSVKSDKKGLLPSLIRQWCWICFLFLSRDQKWELYCRKCKAYLGTYDPKTRMVTRLSTRQRQHKSHPKMYESLSAPAVSLSERKD